MDRFFVAHRGSGDDWTEHSLAAYRKSLAAGADAVEISVCATSDGVLICHHDLTGSRLLGVDRPIAEMTWDEVSQHRLDARRWLGPGAAVEPVARLEDVLVELGDEFLAFIEDKQGTNTGAILDVLDRQDRAVERFVWKQWAPAQQVTAVAQRGYAAWGYLDAESLDRLAEFAGVFAALGVPVGFDDAAVRTVVSAGKPVIAWEVHLHDDVRRLAELGVTGMMCSNIPYLVSPRPADADAFATGRRAAGDLPSDFASLGWSAQPDLLADTAVLRMQRSTPSTYLMGSLAQVGAPLRAARFTMTWPSQVPTGARAGIAFALPSDAESSALGAGGRGYRLTLGADGVTTLYDNASGAEIGRAVLAPPQPGEPVTFRVELGDARVTVGVDGAGSALIDVADSGHRGEWLRLVVDDATGAPVDFSAVGVDRG